MRSLWFFSFFILLTSLSLSSLLHAESDKSPEKKTLSRAYKLESITVKGTHRLTAEQIRDHLNINKGDPLNDEFVMSTRARLLSLGLFKSVILIMNRGTKKGWAALVIEVEDDPNILGDWAIGGSAGITQSEEHAATANPETAPLGYRMSLISRNFFGLLHRSSVEVDIDSEGIFRQGQVAYGLPRFEEEGVRIDAQASTVDVSYRYLNALGFGSKAQLNWVKTIEDLGEYYYGAALYLNNDRFSVPGHPERVAGPRIGFQRETRLISFVPDHGYLAGVSFLLEPLEARTSVLEVNLAQTFRLFDSNRITFSADALAVGIDAYSARATTRLDLPLSSMDLGGDQAQVFVSLKGGVDESENVRLNGSAAIFGIRYLSSGFIAEFALQVTENPETLFEKKPTVAERSEDAPFL